MNDVDRSHDELRDLLGVYALDAVEPDEARAVEAHLAECPQCRAEVEEHRSVASLLGNVGAAAPVALWDRITESLHDESLDDESLDTDDHAVAPLGAAGPADAARGEVQDHVLSFPVGGREARDARVARRRGRAVVALTAVAAACLLVAGVAGVVTIRQQQERVDDLAAQVADTRDDRSAAQALADPGSSVVSLTSSVGEVEVRAVIGADGTGYLLGSPLPDAGADATYQLWGLAGTRAVSLGLLGHDPRVFQFHIEDPVTGLAITTEQEGGADQPTTDPLVTGVIPANDDEATLPS